MFMDFLFRVRIDDELFLGFFFTFVIERNIWEGNFVFIKNGKN